jgi:hypothetical protein
MGNSFDSLADGMFDITTTLMGYEASWTPKAGGTTHQAQVHYKAADKDRAINDNRYKIATGIMEVKTKDFPGLKTSLDSKTKETITITIDDTATEFFAFEADHIADGKILKVYLQQK